MVKTEIGYTTVDAITVRGLNLANDILGKFDFVDMVVLTTMGRKPSAQEKVMLNLLLVTAADHGLTPSALSARLTYLGAPEALQGAVASGLLGAGSVFLGTTQNAAQMLIDGAQGLSDASDEQAVAKAAADLVASMKAARRPVFGVGHPIHVNGDPRVPVMREISQAEGFYGIHWRLMDAIAAHLQSLGKRLPMNAVGACAAIIADMKLDPLLGRGLMLTGRCAGLVGHILEERATPIGQELWDLVLSQDPRNEVP
ncbi:citryl-CoA lyase [Hydrogenophaga sp. BPS33]|uniref:citryl-CoA lyase n=1 Tax=Hydrogenophaga sp. BPS33 TaxID=2651974 RepID=UPI00131F9202|nr:citryl-CoA lyase [Hydrogenophaga sp. BPS33]QHE84672.1 citryl-CoA lyase [Hydrogenophaga sp. BPS33]